MPPLQFTDEEMALLRELAEPIPYRQRQEFLSTVAQELANRPQRGAGVVFDVAREVQRGFVVEARWTPPERETSGAPRLARGRAPLTW